MIDYLLNSYFKAGPGKLFTIAGHINCGISREVCKKFQLYLTMKNPTKHTCFFLLYRADPTCFFNLIRKFNIFLHFNAQIHQNGKYIPEVGHMIWSHGPHVPHPAL